MSISAYKVLVGLSGGPRRRIAKAGIIQIGGVGKKDTRLNVVEVYGNGTTDKRMVAYALSALSEDVERFGLQEGQW